MSPAELLESGEVKEEKKPKEWSRTRKDWLHFFVTLGWLEPLFYGILFGLGHADVALSQGKWVGYEGARFIEHAPYIAAWNGLVFSHKWIGIVGAGITLIVLLVLGIIRTHSSIERHP